MSTTSKEYEFPVSVAWAGGKRVHARVAGKQAIDIATPPEFRGDCPETWSPEDFLVAAAASCFAVTVVGIAARTKVPLHDLAIDAVGRVGPREDGQFGFRAIELDVKIETDGERVEDARAVVERAERGCLVSMALGILVEVELDVHGLESSVP